MKRWVICSLLIFAIACKKEEAIRAAAKSDGVAEPQAVAAAPARSPATPAAENPAPQLQPRMIIRNASLSLIVRDATAAAAKIASIAEARGGYVAESRQWKENEQMRASQTLRVPANQLASALQALRGVAERVESEGISTQDVSQEYVDLSAQLRNLQAAELELRELLRTVRERTQKAADIMEVYAELTKTRGEIEKIQGRMQYLSQMTAMSTITVDLIPDALAAPVVEPGWQPAATVRSAARSLISALKGIADAMIWVILYLAPLALIFIVIALIVRSVWRALRKLRKASAEA